MAESSSKKNLKRSFLEDEESNKQPPQKRVRFPKGKKSKPESLVNDKDALAVGEARLAAVERAKLRSKITSDLFIQDGEGFVNDITAAEEAYENDGNRTEDGIQIEAFSLAREKEEGYFDDDGNFVEYVREKETKDAWLDSIENNPMYIGRSDANDTEKDEDPANETSVEELSQEDIGVIKRRIADILEPGETVLQALRRLKGNTNNRKEKMSSEKKLIFDQLTEDADKLLQNGDYNVYNERQEVFQREAEGYERLAQARVNGTESCDIFGDDEDDPDPNPSSNLLVGSISSTQLNSNTATAEGGALQSDYVYDESSGYYYSSSLGYYYDPNTGLYCSATTGKWYKYDEEKKEYEEVSDVA